MYKSFKGICIYFLLINTVGVTLSCQAQIAPAIPGIQVQNIGGNNFQVTTALVNGRFALNSFNQFTIQNNQTFNFVLPVGVGVLINRVSPGIVSNIDGTLNLKIGQADGPVGGTLIHISPGGINMGNNSFVNVGSGLFLTSSSTQAATVTGGQIDLNTVTPPAFLNINNEIDPAININAVNQAGSTIINNGTVTSNLVSNDGSGGLDFRHIGFVGERITNAGTVQFNQIANNGSLLVPLDQGGTVTFLGTGGSTFNLVNNQIQQTIPASSLLSSNGNVTNTGNVISPSGVINLISNANTTAGNANTIVNAGILNTDATAIDTAGGTISLITTGHLLPDALGGTINQNGVLTANGLGNGDGGEIFIETNTFLPNIASIISVLPGSNLVLGGTINLDRQTPGGVDLGFGQIAGNLVVDNNALSTMNTALPASRGELNIGLNNNNVNTVNITDVTTPSNTDISIFEQNTTNINGINNFNGTLSVESVNGIINVNGEIDVITTIGQDRFLLDPAVNLEANTLNIGPGGFFNITNQDPFVGGFVNFTADNLSANGVGISGSTSVPGGIGGGLSVSRRTDGIINVHNDGIDINNDNQSDLTFNNVTIAASGANRGGTLSIGNGLTNTTINILGRPSGNNGTLGPNTTFIFESNAPVGNTSINFNGLADFSDSNMLINAGNGNVNTGLLSDISFGSLTLQSGGNTNIINNADGIDIIGLFSFGGEFFNTQVFNTANFVTAGDFNATGDFNNLSLLNTSPNSVSNILDTQGILNLTGITTGPRGILNINTQNGDLNIFNPVTVGTGTFTTGGINDILAIDSNVTSTDNNLLFSSSRTSVGNNILINSARDTIFDRGATPIPGTLNLNLDGNVDSSDPRGSTIIGSETNTSSVIIGGNQAGNLVNQSPFTRSTTLTGNTGGINTDVVQINIIPVNDPPFPSPGENNNNPPRNDRNIPFTGSSNTQENQNSMTNNPPPVNNVDFFMNTFNFDTGFHPENLESTHNRVVQGLTSLYDTRHNMVNNPPPPPPGDTHPGDYSLEGHVDQVDITLLKDLFSNHTADQSHLEESLGAYLAKKLEQNNNLEDEFDADKLGTLFSSEAGYHVRGLESFLNLISFYEKKSRKGYNQGEQNISSAFSYRHPKTSRRLEYVQEEVRKISQDTNSNLTTHPIINTTDFKNILKQIKAHH